MPETVPGDARVEAGFAQVVRGAFEFLERDHGFRVAREESTLVRYEGGRRFVNVFWGRGSYELGVEVGRWVDLDGKIVEQRFGLDFVVALTSDPESIGFRSFSATDRAGIESFVPQLAGWTRDFVEPALADGDGAFELMSARSAQESERFLQEGRASTLRARAAAAWGAHNFADVVLAYREMIDELPLVQLQRSEIGRLRYAEGKLSDDF